MHPLHRSFSRASMVILLPAALLTACGGGSGDPAPKNDNPIVKTGYATGDSGTASNNGTSTVEPQPAPVAMETAAWPPAAQASPTTACAAPLKGSHATYDVGPGKPYTELTEVPWLSLQAGDVVNIHYRATPYLTKFGLRAQGTASAPVIINGVTDANCQRPVISGNKAVTATDAIKAGYGKDIQGLGLITIYRLPTDAWDSHTPRYITIQNLKLTGAREGNPFTNQAGANAAYDAFSAGIYAVKVHNLTVENCEITGNGLGVFTNNKGDSPDGYSANIIIRRNRIYDNGYTNHDTEHNLYIQARRVLYEGNDIGQAFNGSSLKDRSSGTVIRYNRILASARALDLVETEEEIYHTVQNDPLYHHAWVYGNIIVNDSSAAGGFSVNIVHWGFDNNPAKSRSGTLFFYQNTVVNKVDQSRFWYSVPFQLGKDGTAPAGIRVEAFNNVFWQQGNNEWRFLSDVGTLQFTGTNFVSPNWYPSVPNRQPPADVRTSGARLIADTSPGIDPATWMPAAGAMVLGQSLIGPGSTPSGTTAANLRVTHQYKQGVGLVALPADLTGAAGALGAQQRP